MNAHSWLLPSEFIHQRGMHAPFVEFYTIAITCFNSERYSWTTCMFHPALHVCCWKMLKEPGVLTHKGIQSSFRRWNGSFSWKSKEENPLDETVPFNLPALMPAGHKNRQAHPRTGFGPEMIKKAAITLPNLCAKAPPALTPSGHKNRQALRPQFLLDFIRLLFWDFAIEETCKILHFQENVDQCRQYQFK